MREKSIQIPEVLFLQICQYFFIDELTEAEREIKEKAIRQGLTDKLDRVVEHNLYSRYKTAPTDEEKERARKEYVEKKGIPKDFRW